MTQYFFSLPALRILQRSNWVLQYSRNFAVKELSWCSNFKSALPTNKTDASQAPRYNPIERFGIIAAMSNNNIIGVKGTIPWNVPADRKEFVRITSGKVLVVGRKTFEEQENLSHISHSAKCIVISESLSSESIQSKVSSIKTEVLIVRSFPEALDVARRLDENKTSIGTGSLGNSMTDDINCWIAGGQGIYHKSVLHPSAYTIRLTVINIDVDVTSYSPSEVARFPPKYHWDNRFNEVSSIKNATQDEEAIQFTQYIYKKKSF
jgi:dihydrofolate reductase